MSLTALCAENGYAYYVVFKVLAGKNPRVAGPFRSHEAAYRALTWITADIPEAESKLATDLRFGQTVRDFPVVRDLLFVKAYAKRPMFNDAFGERPVAPTVPTGSMADSERKEGRAMYLVSILTSDSELMFYVSDLTDAAEHVLLNAGVAVEEQRMGTHEFDDMNDDLKFMGALAGDAEALPFEYVTNGGVTYRIESLR